MPAKCKVYQKKTAIRRKFASLKFFFWPLYATSRHFKQCPHNIVSSTDGLIFRAGVTQARPLFLFISLCRVRLCWRATGAAQRGSRQVQDRGIVAKSPCSPCCSVSAMAGFTKRTFGGTEGTESGMESQSLPFFLKGVTLWQGNANAKAQRKSGAKSALQARRKDVIGCAGCVLPARAEF